MGASAADQEVKDNLILCPKCGGVGMVLSWGGPEDCDECGEGKVKAIDHDELLGMKAVSIHQPYAGLIATGAKTIETRGYATKHRGPIVICSTQRWHPDVNIGDYIGHPLCVERASQDIDVSKQDELTAHAVPDCDCGDWEEGIYDDRCAAQFDWHPAILRDEGAHGLSVVSLLPQGVALGVADLVDCLPIVGTDERIEMPWMPHIGEAQIGGSLGVWRKSNADSLMGVPFWDYRDISDQWPRGDFTPGNYGWMLENFKPFDQPVPVKGQQQIWTVKPSNLSGRA